MTQAQTKINIEVNGNKLTATLVDNSATKALITLLQKKPITIHTSEYGGFEMVGDLPQSLPKSDSHVSTHPGDFVLYLGHEVSFFYGHNSWSYTCLGSIDNAGKLDLRSILGAEKGKADFVLSLKKG
ncbi:MAG: cyclophilin-like fold protein [Prevotella sp.]|jgi:hypothetical protein